MIRGFSDPLSFHWDEEDDLHVEFVLNVSHMELCSYWDVVSGSHCDQPLPSVEVIRQHLVDSASLDFRRASSDVKNDQLKRAAWNTLHKAMRRDPTMVRRWIAWFVQDAFGGEDACLAPDNPSNRWYFPDIKKRIVSNTNMMLTGDYSLIQLIMLHCVGRDLAGFACTCKVLHAVAQEI